MSRSSSYLLLGVPRQNGSGEPLTVDTLSTCELVSHTTIVQKPIHVPLKGQNAFLQVLVHKLLMPAQRVVDTKRYTRRGPDEGIIHDTIIHMPQDPVVVDTKENGLFKGYHIQHFKVVGSDGRYAIVNSGSFPAFASRHATQISNSSKWTKQ
ncbi:hypothetical protein ARMSODRAFT_976177 [Armillaria solidipes]|uniref:Uncharacterized protein n=1 Tax=Armillaria solidipes TaxID=1076256 RepID=A0A2H3BBX0_9AGAR|nr:hypothetical protein ARMSODRAFT_976177 [Armillaria solidipes]